MQIYSLSLSFPISFTVATATAAVYPTIPPMAVSNSVSGSYWENPVEILATPPRSNAIAQNASPNNWQQFTYLQAGFAVRMPKIPKEVTEEIGTSFGKLNVHTLSAQQSGIGYLAVYANYPNNDSRQPSRQQILQTWKQEFVNAAGLQILQERQIDFNGYPGTEIRYTNDSGEIGKARFYFVEQRIYQVLAATSKQESDRFRENADRFLDSFELLDN